MEQIEYSEKIQFRAVHLCQWPSFVSIMRLLVL